jgi:molybdate transport system permease protein
MTPRRRAPAGIVPVAWLAIAFLAVPLVGLLWRAPWRSTWDVLDSHEALTALRLSLETSIAATAVAVVLGLPLAWVLARVESRARPVLRALTTLPMVLPPVVGGTALLLALGRRASSVATSTTRASTCHST